MLAMFRKRFSLYNLFINGNVCVHINTPHERVLYYSIKNSGLSAHISRIAATPLIDLGLVDNFNHMFWQIRIKKNVTMLTLNLEKKVCQFIDHVSHPLFSDIDIVDNFQHMFQLQVAYALNTWTRK